MRDDAVALLQAQAEVPDAGRLMEAMFTLMREQREFVRGRRRCRQQQHDERKTGQGGQAM